MLTEIMRPPHHISLATIMKIWTFSQILLSACLLLFMQGFPQKSVLPRCKDWASVNSIRESTSFCVSHVTMERRWEQSDHVEKSFNILGVEPLRSGWISNWERAWKCTLNGLLSCACQVKPFPASCCREHNQNSLPEEWTSQTQR